MHFKVPIKRAFGLETFPTDPTGIWFLPGMDQHMSLKVHILHEALPAYLAQEAALLVVKADMCVQGLFLGKAFPTQAAGERPLTRVDFQVCLQVATLVESLPTEAAAVGFLPSVDPQVHLQRRLAREALPADAAGAASLAVRAQVGSKAVRGLIMVSAESTAAVRVLQVSRHVFH